MSPKCFAIVGAVIGATTAAITDGNIGMGALTGAITGAIFAGAGSLVEAAGQGLIECTVSGEIISNTLPAAGQAAIYSMAGATAGGINGAISGGNAGTAALVGGIMGGLGSLGGPNFQPFGSSASNEAANIGNRLFNSAVTGAVFGGSYAAATGGNIGQGAAMGAMGWAAGEALNMAVGRTMGSIMSGGNREFINGVAYYYVKGQGPFTIGGAVIGDQERIQNEKYIIDGQIYKTDQHERSHIRIQQTPLSVSYIPVHIISQGISAVVSKLLGYGLNTHRFNIFERWWTDAPSY